MKENILMNIEFKKQIKKWRNTSIALICIILFVILSTLTKKDTPTSGIFEESIVEIEINGIITRDDFRDERIAEIQNNNKIKAVILNIDSPGGMVTPSETLYNLLYQINQTKPVVAIMNGMATSGAYLIALGAEYIIAKNTTLTGSIGVILQSYEFVDMAKKLGIGLKTFKSSELKGMPSYIERNTEKSNIAIQSTVNDIHSYFIQLIRERRNKITEENFKIAISGQAFTGRQALEIGIIDEIGDKNAALKYLESKKINTKLPIRKLNLKKKANIGILQKFIGKAFDDNLDGLMAIHNF